MKLLLVDDEVRALNFLARIIKRVYPDAELFLASTYQEALEYGAQDIDVAFLDIEMPGMSGLVLGEKLEELHNNRLNIIFVTAYEQYARDAYSLHASGYLTKPYDREEIQKEMENLRYPIGSSRKNGANEEDKGKNKLKIRCFGNFEVFYDNKPIHFDRTDSKEILAYLVSLRGSTANRREICSNLWEDAVLIERRRTYFRTLIMSLKQTLKKYDAEDMLVTQRDSYAINTEACDCDYYHYLNKEPGSEDLFRGEFMSQYSWGENTLGLLLDDEKF